MVILNTYQYHLALKGQLYVSFKWNDWLEIYIETATYTDLKNPTTTNYRITSCLHIYTSKVQTNMGNQIFNDNIMQLTWHINKHGCNIYAWVQLSKWKVENTMLEHLFLLRIEIYITTCSCVLYCKVLSNRPPWHAHFCSHFTVLSVQKYKTCWIIYLKQQIYVVIDCMWGASSSIKLFYNIRKTVFLMKLKILQSKYK